MIPKPFEVKGALCCYVTHEGLFSTTRNQLVCVVPGPTSSVLPRVRLRCINLHFTTNRAGSTPSRQVWGNIYNSTNKSKLMRKIHQIQTQTHEDILQYKHEQTQTGATTTITSKYKNANANIVNAKKDMHQWNTFNTVSLYLLVTKKDFVKRELLSSGRSTGRGTSIPSAASW